MKVKSKISASQKIFSDEEINYVKGNPVDQKAHKRQLQFYDEEGKLHSFLTVIDTGSSSDVIDTGLAREKGLKIRPVQGQVFRSFSGTKRVSKGIVDLAFCIDEQLVEIEFSCVDMPGIQLIVGDPTIQFLNLRYESGEFLSPNGVKISDCKKNEFRSLEAPIFENFFIENEIDEYEIQTLEKLNLISAKQLAQETDIELLQLKEVEKEIRTCFEANAFMIADDVTTQQKSRLLEILLKHKSVFATSKEQVGELKFPDFEYNQEFTVENPPAVQQYPLNLEKREIIHKEIQKMLSMGIIEEAKGAQVVTANMLVVPKKNTKELRCVIDLRKLNTVTLPSNRQIPRIDDILNKLNGGRYYVSIDVQKAFWSIKLPVAQRKFYTLADPVTNQVYQYRVMPMGHRNSAQWFQTYLERVLQRGGSRAFTTYIDDVNAKFADVDTALKEIDLVLESLETAGLKIGLKKCNFLASEIPAFGYRISRAGIFADPGRVRSILEIPTPKNGKELLSFLASLNYYRTLIPGFAGKVSNLYKLTSSKAEFVWTEDRQKEFEAIKAAMAQSIQLSVIEFDQPFHLKTDASIYGTAGILSQFDSEGKERVVGVTSATLKGSETFWSIANLELLAVYRGLVAFERLLEFSKVHLTVDNSVVYFLLKSGISKTEISRRTPSSRFLLFISEFDYTISHAKGDSVHFKFADLLSRVSTGAYKLQLGTSSKDSLVKVTNETGELLEVNVALEEKVKKVPLLPDFEKTTEAVKLAQLESKKVKEWIVRPPKGYTVIQGHVYRVTRKGLKLHCPDFYANDLVKSLHIHQSAQSLLGLLNQLQIHITFKYQRVLAVTMNCNDCSPGRSHPSVKHISNSIANPTLPLDVIHLDVMVLAKNSIAVFRDSFTKFIIAKKLKNDTGKAMQDTCLSVFCHYGFPNVLVSDNGPNMACTEMSSLCETFGVVHSRSAPFNSRGNSLVERAIGEIQLWYRQHQPAENELVDFLPICCFLINTRVREGDKYSPFEKFFARETGWGFKLPDLSVLRRGNLSSKLRQFYDHVDQVRSLEVAKIRRKRENLKNETRQSPLKKGDKVRIRSYRRPGIAKKLFRPWSYDLYRVIKVFFHTGSLLLQKIVEDPREQPIRRIAHQRNVIKVIKAPPGDDEDFEECEGSEEFGPVGHGQKNSEEPRDISPAGVIETKKDESATKITKHEEMKTMAQKSTKSDEMRKAERINNRQKKSSKEHKRSDELETNGQIHARNHRLRNRRNANSRHTMVLRQRKTKM